MIFNLIYKFSVFFPIIFFGGCQTLSQIIENKSLSTHNDVFTEFNQDDLILTGDTVLNVNLSIKRDEPEKYSDIETGRLTKSTFPVVLNIDGQAIVWDATGRLENSELKNDKDLNADETGKGIKYSLSKKVKLKTGRHKVFLAAPSVDFAKEFTVTLSGQRDNTLSFRPQYGHRQCENQETFLSGFRSFDIFLDDQVIFQSKHTHYKRSGRRGACQ
jgi:hypothetical protein